MRTGQVHAPLGIVTHRATGLVLRRLAGRMWGRRIFYELRCDLRQLPDVPSARLPVRMRPGAHKLASALENAREARGGDYLQARFLRRLLAGGAREPFLAQNEGGIAIYCQWLIRPRDHEQLAHVFPGRYHKPAPGEVLLEGAFTFPRFRGSGVMADGMGQLLRIARLEGYSFATTFTAADNPASLRGCGKVGFGPHRAYMATYRLGRRRQIALDSDIAWRPWERAIAPRGSDP